MLSPNRALMRGIPTKVGEAINTTGTSQVRGFSSLVATWSTPTKCFAQALNGTFTVFSGNIEISMDGGTTWGKFQTFDLFANLTFDFEIANGLLFRFNITSITQTGPPDIFVSV